MKAKVIIAGPGTGKTHRIIELVHQFLNETAGTNEGFILCTFTRKAAEELQFRLFEESDVSLFAGRQYLIDTIHSISLSLLRLHPEGKYADFDIIPEDRAASYVNGQLPRLGFDRDEYKGQELWNLCSEIAQIYGYITDREIVIENFDFSISSKLKTIVEHYQIYRKLLYRDNLFDFAVVQAELKSELKSNPDFKKNISNTFNAFFIDEYQDTNPMQHQLLMAISEPEYNIVVVGDDDQSIYGFRGASVDNLLQLPHFYANEAVPYELEYLEDNRRSVSEIVSISKNFISESGISGFEKDINSFRGPGLVLPTVHEFESINEEAIAVALSIEHLLKTGGIKSCSQIAILLRTARNRAKDFSNALSAQGIPSKMIGVGDFFELIFVQEFLTILGFIFSTDVKAIDIFRNDLTDLDQELSDYYFDGDVITRILDIKDNWRSYKSSIAITYDLLNAANFFERYRSQGKNLGKLTQIVMNHDESMKGLDLYGLFSYLSYLRREKLIDLEDSEDADAVQIMTLHRAKGLQFDAVYMPVQNETNPPVSTIDIFKDITGISSSNHSDELRLFYVGMTRARNYLWISRSRTSPAGKKSYVASAGYKIVSSQTRFHSKQETFLESDTIKATARQEIKIPILSYNSIYTYLICPKQYMYRNEWHLETARNAGMTYGSNLHKVLQMVNAEMANGYLSTDIDLTKAMDIAWKPNWRASESENLKFKATAEKQVQLYLDTYNKNFTDYYISGVEKQFDFSFNNTLITGRYDVVFKNDNEYLIVDFKTGDERDYSFQMSFYKFCLESETQNENVHSKIYYLNSGELKKTNISSREEVKSLIEETKEKIETKNFLPTPGQHCTDCAFNLMCVESSTRS